MENSNRGNFTTEAATGGGGYHTFCDDCRKAGRPHTVVDVPAGHTDGKSDWGPGVPLTMRECNVCHRKDGPWVSAESVGWY